MALARCAAAAAARLLLQQGGGAAGLQHQGAAVLAAASSPALLQQLCRCTRQQLLLQPPPQQACRALSTTTPTAASTDGGPPSSSSSPAAPAAAPGAPGSAQKGGEDVVSHLDKVMEVMMGNPAMLEMMLARMPPHMRRPEVLRAMLANPDVRSRINALAHDKGMAAIISSVDVGRMAQGVSATVAAGIDPASVIARFQQSPTLAAAMEEPRVLAALMDMASNGADALKKYEGDKAIIEAAMEAGDILQQLQQQQQAGMPSPASESSSSPASSSSADLSAATEELGVEPGELMQRLLARPDLLARVQNPEVQAALMEVSQRPWKIVKYLLNSEVMAALKDMKEMLQQPPAGKR